MRKPDGYDNSAAYTGESTALPAGGYICKIKKAVEAESTTHRPMLVLLFDIVEGDFANYYQQQYDRVKKSNPNAKWGGVFRQLVDGKSLPFFKGMVTAIEQSNDFVWDFDESKLQGKMFGALFGREQYLGNDGTMKWATKCVAIRTVDTIRNGAFEIPEDKPLANHSEFINSPATFDDDNDLPF